MPELRELIDKSRELYPKAFKGAKFREVEKIWRFPSGASLEFGYLDRDADVYRYQGQSYTWIGIDELTQYPTEFPLQYLQSRLRTTNKNIQCYIRCTANPGGVGGSWVRKRYLDPAPPNTSFFGEDKISRNFGMSQPEGYRKAARLMKLAEDFSLPIITFIDTPGAYPGIESEERGMSEAIAKNLSIMSGLKVPIIVIITGEGGSGGA